MIYNIFWFLTNIAIRVFYGKIEVSGLDNVPKDGPLLIASNHPNGFLEPIIIACLFPRALHFMVRGDVFNKPWLRPFLVRTNQIPIFRFKDGFKELRKNDSSLQVAYKALDKGAAIILFIEGGTQSIKTLRPFQKGMARMANSYLEVNNSGKELNIMPVAINFVSPFKLRSRVCLNVGESFVARSYFKDPETKVKDIKRLTDDVYNKVLPLAFNVKEKARQPILNHTLQLTEGLFKLNFFPIVSQKDHVWPTLKSVADTINLMNESTFTSFSKEIESIRDANPYEVKRTGKGYIVSLIWTILAFIPGLIGLILNIIPGLISQGIAKKVLNKDNTVFIASIILSTSVILYPIYYSAVILILSCFFGWKAFLFLLAWPLGFVYLFWKNNYSSSIARSRYHLTEEEKRNVKDTLLKYKINLVNTDV
jgi:glycerol-3-phosphate O-acyltransferase/dihydroxyacetone phosphate acyltransferase